VGDRTGERFKNFISISACHLTTCFVVLELGAGSALPSLLMSTRPDPPSLIVVTDYPDDGILGNLRRNVDRNRALVAAGCTLECVGYEWGTDPSELL